MAGISHRRTFRNNRIGRLPRKIQFFPTGTLYIAIFSLYVGYYILFDAAWIEAKIQLDLLIRKSVDCIFIDVILQTGIRAFGIRCYRPVFHSICDKKNRIKTTIIMVYNRIA